MTADTQADCPPVEIAFLDVGQGDSIVVSVPSTGEAVVIDCADADTVFRYLKDRCIRRVRALLLTHLHTDHCSGAVQFLDNCERELRTKCESLYFNWGHLNRKTVPSNVSNDADQHSDAESLADPVKVRKNLKRGLRIWSRQHRRSCGQLAQGGIHFEFPGAFREVLELVHPWHADVDELLSHGLNNTSAVIRVRGNGSTALLTGDIEEAAWDSLLETDPDLKADVLKFPHHGGWSSNRHSVDHLLDRIDPSIVIMSVGSTGGGYDHPNDHVFSAIAQRAPRTRLLCTQATGKCGAHNGSRMHSVGRLDTHAQGLGRPLLVAPRGCPCAGTVVILLDQQPQVLQPEIVFHRDQIIRPIYQTHRCALF